MRSGRFDNLARPALAALLLLAVAFVPVACAKDEPEPVDPVGPTPVPTDPPYFTWTTGANNVTVADSSFCYVSNHVIFAFKGGNSNVLEIRLSGFSTGNYIISSATGNQVEYQTGTQVYNGTGTVNISASEATKLSGSFTCQLSGGTLTAMSGSFAAVPKR